MLLSAYDRESITVSNAVIGFTAIKINRDGEFKTQRVEFIVEAAPIRFTLDGTDPTTTIGTPVGINDVITIEEEHDIKNFKAIRLTLTDAIIQPTYFRGW